MIPGRRNRKVPIEHNWERNVVERGIGVASQCHHLATRFEKTALTTWGS